MARSAIDIFAISIFRPADLISVDAETVTSRNEANGVVVAKDLSLNIKIRHIAIFTAVKLKFLCIYMFYNNFIYWHIICL
jgi:hypothetical protein